VENLNVCRILVGRTERSIVRSRHRFKNNIKIYLKGIGWDGVVWIHLAQDKDKWRVHINTVLELSCSTEYEEIFVYVKDYQVFKKRLFPCSYRGADKSLTLPTLRCIFFDGENISFDASLVTYIQIVIIILQL
jgi:hypothetical protein